MIFIVIIAKRQYWTQYQLLSKKMCYLVYKVFLVQTKTVYKSKWRGGTAKWLELQIKALSRLFEE